MSLELTLQSENILQARLGDAESWKELKALDVWNQFL